MKTLKEPLLHFVALALLIFAFEYITSRSDKTEIIVSKATADYLIKQREDLELRSLNETERAETIDGFIEEEILYNEAYNRGLDRSDSRIRRNLILKMRGLLGGEIPEPSEEQLRQWFEQNQDRFSLPETWSIQQVYFSDARIAPHDLLKKLNDGMNPDTIGDDQWNMRRRLPNSSQSELVSLFGAPTARSIIAIDDGDWHGPFESQLGLHFVRITAHRPEQVQDFEQVNSYLNGYWVLEKTRERIDEEVAILRDDYEIIIEQGVTQ